MTENRNTIMGQAVTTFSFSEVFWQKTTILFGFYWLFRWLWPSLLPESLQAANFQMQMLACGAGGLVLTLFAAVSHAASAERTPARNTNMNTANE